MTQRKNHIKGIIFRVFCIFLGMTNCVVLPVKLNNNVVYAQEIENATDKLFFKYENLKIYKTGESRKSIEKNVAPNAREKIVKGNIAVPEIKKIMFVHATAYNSLENQTDSTPHITANGYNLYQSGIEDTVAANFLPFGARIRIPDHFGDRIFVVRDRMNKRYKNRIDVWMKDYDKAIQFGKKYVKIEILENFDS